MPDTFEFYGEIKPIKKTEKFEKSYISVFVEELIESAIPQLLFQCFGCATKQINIINV